MVVVTTSRQRRGGIEGASDFKERYLNKKYDRFFREWVLLRRGSFRGGNSMLFLQYLKCSTCKKAKKWLDDREIQYKDRHIVENNPKKEELKAWYEQSGYPIKKFFNTSGKAYREAGMKDKVPHMTEDEIFEVLALNGMMVKRPILVGKDFVLVGFKENEWEENIIKNFGV